MTGSSFAAVIVGAGPAGSAAATALAARGHTVLLLEKDEFPRDKVCGEFLSAEAQTALASLGVADAVARVGPERILRGAVHPDDGEAVSFDLPRPALGISRRVFDDLLARRAAAAGADLRFHHRVVSIDGDLASGFRLRAAGVAGDLEVSARTVIGAWGRWNALDRELERGFERARSAYLGWSRDFVGDTGFLEGRVHLYVFPGGYCGLSRVEDGEVNLAGVISESEYRRLDGGWEAVVRSARSGNAGLDADLARVRPGPRGFLGVGPVHFTAKPPVEEDILMVGDAAGVIDPFSGQGQAAALRSGLLAAEVADQYLRGSLEAGAARATYGRRWKKAFASGFAWSAALRSVMLNPRLGRVAGRIAGRSLVRLGIAATRGAGPFRD
ncbi:MAG: NAD(P)/FAD-dependent oxidoreductase [Thermoanaerobaculia bacterium]